MTRAVEYITFFVVSAVLGLVVYLCLSFRP